jgi:hypothetical protein
MPPQSSGLTLEQARALGFVSKPDSSEGFTLEQAQQMGFKPTEEAPTLLASRKAASKAEFEQNLPPSTIGTRAREAAIGVLEPFDLHNVPGLVQAVGGLLHDALSGNVMATLEKTAGLAKGIVSAPIEPVKNIVEGLAEGDTNRAAYGAGGFLSQTVPAVVQGLQMAQKVVHPPAPGTAEGIYRSALKPPITLEPAAAHKIVETGLKNQIPISEEGVAKLNRLVDDLNKKVETRIAGTTATIQPSDVAKRLSKTEATFQRQALPEADVQAVQRARQEFMAQHQTPAVPAVPPQPMRILSPTGQVQMTPGTPAVPAKDIPITAEEAQALKTGTYRQLKNRAFGELKSADIEAQKALARGLKQELEKQFPELETLNAQESALLKLDPVLEKAVNRAINANGGRIGPMIAGGAARVLTGSRAIGTAAGILKAVLDDPETASKLAFAIYKAQQKQPYRFGPPNMLTGFAKVAALSTALRSTAIADSSGVK